MSRNEKNILQHEFIGLTCEVVESRNSSSIGTKGKVVDETMKTFVIKNGGKTKSIFKKGAKFKLDLNSKNVIVDGDFLVARPEDRIKKQIKKW